MPRGCLRFVIVVFPDHTHLLFLSFKSIVNEQTEGRTKTDCKSSPCHFVTGELKRAINQSKFCRLPPFQTWPVFYNA